MKVIQASTDQYHSQLLLWKADGYTLIRLLYYTTDKQTISKERLTTRHRVASRQSIGGTTKFRVYQMRWQAGKMYNANQVLQLVSNQSCLLSSTNTNHALSSQPNIALHKLKLNLHALSWTTETCLDAPHLQLPEHQQICPSLPPLYPIVSVCTPTISFNITQSLRMPHCSQATSRLVPIITPSFPI